MAQDDMHVVIYKILAVIYSAMKRGVEPERADYSAAALGIPEEYWKQIVRELVDHGYVTGIDFVQTTTGPAVNLARPRVTLDGVEFLMENGMMRKALKFLQDTKSAVPFI